MNECIFTNMFDVTYSSRDSQEQMAYQEPLAVLVTLVPLVSQ